MFLSTQHTTMHQVMNRLAGKRVSIIFLSQKRIPINFQPTRRGDTIEVVEIIETLERLTDGIQLIVWRNVHPGLRSGNMRVSPTIIFGKGKMHHDGAVFDSKPISEIVAHASVLTGAADGFNRLQIQGQPEIATSQLHDRHTGPID